MKGGNMVFERTCSFWVPDLMIFCIIELHLSLLLTCLRNSSWSKTNKTHIRISWRDGVFFATQLKNMPIKKLLNHLSEQYLSNSQPLKTTRSLTQCKVLRKKRSGHPCFGTWHPIDRYCFFCFKVKHFPIPLTKNEQTARPPNKTPHLKRLD